MSRNLPRRRWSDRLRIDILDRAERIYWAKFLGVEERDILDAVDRVGTCAERVRQYINLHRTPNWIVDRGRPERRQGQPARRHFESL